MIKLWFKNWTKYETISFIIISLFGIFIFSLAPAMVNLILYGTFTWWR